MFNLLMGAVFSSDEEDEVEKTREKKVAEEADGAVKSPQDDEAASVHREIRVGRERGDGSEAAPPSPPSKRAEDVNWIHLPKTNIKLEKLPPIRDLHLELPQPTHKSPLVALPIGPTSRQCRGTIKKDKEPKFVPYEPYKAAITPLESKKHSKKGAQALKRSPAVESGTKSESPEDTTGETVADEEDKDSIRLTKKDEEIATLKKELAEKEKQLKIQTQVNTEVKKLLVASVGEDIEAKVDFLTQDKARLAADIRQYASKISRDFEEKEQLYVESNLWKSKFLACSVIVDELARWKANLLHRSEEYDHHIRLLLHEHSVLWTSLANSFVVLSRLQAAFDPLSSSSSPSSSEAASLLGMAEHTLALVKTLKDRLVGEKQIKTKDNVLVPEKIDTPSEENLKAMLCRPPLADISEYSELASLAVSGVAKPHFKKLGDKLVPTTGFKSCTHCHGAVQNI